MYVVKEHCTMSKRPSQEDILHTMQKQRTRSPRTPEDAQELSPPKRRPPQKKDWPTKRPKYRAFQEHTKGQKPVLKAAGIYEKPEDRPDEDRSDDDEEEVGDDGNQGSGDESDDNQYKVPRGMKGDKTALLARGTYGSITEKEREDLLLKVSHWKFL
jgi:hypothetical protein